MFDVEVMLIIAMLMSHLALAQTNGNQFPKAWPEDIVPLHEMTSACYGPGTHEQLRPTCPYNNTIIAVWGVFVGAKQKSDNCPTSVIEWDGNLVDPFNLSRVVDQNTCCFPDEDKDCTFTHGNNDLAFAYYVTSSGYHDALSSLEITWSETKCNDSSFMETTNFMFMNISCIERDRIGFMCTNNSYTTTGEPFYLYNNEYPDPVTSSYGLCRCQVRTSSPSIVLQTLDVRLEEDNAGCGQALRLTDNTTAVEWNCSTAPIFNASQFTFSNNVNVTFTNELGQNGSHVWIGFYDPTSSPMQINCEYETTPSPTDTLTTSTTSIVSTPSLTTITTEQTDSTTGHPTATSESTDKTSGSSDETSGHSLTSTRPSVDSNGTSTFTARTSTVTTGTSTVTTGTSTFTARTSTDTTGTSTVKAGTSTDTARTSPDTAGSATRDPATSIELLYLVIYLLIAVLLLLLIAIVIFTVVQIVKCYRGRKSKVHDLETQRKNRHVARTSRNSSPVSNISSTNTFSSETIPKRIQNSYELSEIESPSDQSNNHVGEHRHSSPVSNISSTNTFSSETIPKRIQNSYELSEIEYPSDQSNNHVGEHRNSSPVSNISSTNTFSSETFPKRIQNSYELSEIESPSEQSNNHLDRHSIQVTPDVLPSNTPRSQDSGYARVTTVCGTQTDSLSSSFEEVSGRDETIRNSHFDNRRSENGLQLTRRTGLEDTRDHVRVDIGVQVDLTDAPRCSGFQNDLNDVSQPGGVSEVETGESEDKSDDNQQAAAATNYELHDDSSKPQDNNLPKIGQKRKKESMRKRGSHPENSDKGQKPPKSPRKRKRKGRDK